MGIVRDILTALLCSEVKEDIDFATGIILAIRKGCDMGWRNHTTPNRVLGAKTVEELKIWKNENRIHIMTINELKCKKEKTSEIPQNSVLLNTYLC